MGLTYGLGADLPGTSSSSSFLGPAPGQALALPMFSPWGSRRGFPREPGPWQARPPRLHGPEPPWQHQQRRGRDGWGLPRPFPGPENFYGKEEEEEMRWAPHDCPPPWDDKEDNWGPEDWHMPGPSEPRPFLGPDFFCGNEEDETQAPYNCPPPWDDRENTQGPEGCFGEGWHPQPQLPNPDCVDWCEFPMEEQHPLPPPPNLPRWVPVLRGGGHRDSLMVSKKDPEPPGAADTPQKSSNSDSKAATEAVEPEQAAGAALHPVCPILQLFSHAIACPQVKPGAGQEPEDTQSPSAPEPASPEESSARLGEHPEVEPCSQSVPKAGADAGSHPDVPTTPAEGGGLLGDLQLSKNSQVQPGAAAEPKVEPSQAGSDICTAPETSVGTQHPPGAGEKELAVGGRPWLCSTLPTSLPAGTDLRSAAILARKEEIELSYQQFSLTIAVVATMLLAKEPSMEGALGLALRANLRQGRIHHLQELEDFINSYDSATLSP
ncbi:uncharacterized protein LRP34_010523 [Phaethornis superciliosus]